MNNEEFQLCWLANGSCKHDDGAQTNFFQQQGAATIKKSSSRMWLKSSPDTWFGYDWLVQNFTNDFLSTYTYMNLFSRSQYRVLMIITILHKSSKIRNKNESNLLRIWAQSLCCDFVHKILPLSNNARVYFCSSFGSKTNFIT